MRCVQAGRVRVHVLTHTQTIELLTELTFFGTDREDATRDNACGAVQATHYDGAGRGQEPPLEKLYSLLRSPGQYSSIPRYTKVICGAPQCQKNMWIGLPSTSQICALKTMKPSFSFISITCVMLEVVSPRLLHAIQPELDSPAPHMHAPAKKC